MRRHLILVVRPMRIVTWNCNGALRKKLAALLALQADIYIIQECEDPERSTDNNYKQWASGSLWTGDNKNRGLGVFSSSERLASLDWESNGLQLFLPFTVNESLTILGVWTRQANSPNFRYIGQAWKYLQAHKDKLPQTNALVLGDFNSNTRWDEWDRWWNHSDVVRELSESGFTSIYHHCNNEQQGQETQNTFFMYRRPDKHYHIDYAFASANIIQSSTITIGNAEDWLEFSDHLPIVVEFSLV